MKTLQFLFALVLLFVLPGSLWSADKVGILEMQKGVLKIRRNFADTIYKEAGAMIPVNTGDQIQTGNNSRAIIRYDKDRGETELYSRTFFMIETVGGETDKFRMPVGKIRFKIPAIKKSKRTAKNRLRLRTANALVSVKGSEAVVGSAKGETTMITYSGDITIANIADPENEIPVLENQASKVVKDAPPLPPVEVPEETRNNIVESDTTLEFEDIQFEEENLQKDEPAPIEEEATEAEEQISEEVEDITETGAGSGGSSSGGTDKEIEITVENP